MFFLKNGFSIIKRAFRKDTFNDDCVGIGSELWSLFSNRIEFDSKKDKAKLYKKMLSGDLNAFEHYRGPSISHGSDGVGNFITDPLAMKDYIELESEKGVIMLDYNPMQNIILDHNPFRRRKVLGKFGTYQISY